MLLTAVVAAMSVWNAQADTYYLNAANTNNTDISDSFTTTSGGAAQPDSTELWKKFCSGQGSAYDGPHKLIIDQARTSTNRIKLDFSPFAVSSLDVTAAANGTWIGNDGKRQYYIGDNTEGATAQTSTFEGDLKLQGTTVDFVGTQTWKIANGVVVTLDTTNAGDNKAAVTVTGALTLSGTTSGAGSLSVRQTITNTSGSVTLDGVAIAISTADVVNGNFGALALQAVTGGNANNGYIQSSDIKLFSNESNVTITPGTAYVSVDGTKYNSLESAYNGVYVLKNSETYSKTVMAEAKKITLANSAILTLNDNLNTAVTNSIEVAGTGAGIAIGKDTTLNQANVSVLSGKTAKLSGTGVYDMGTEATIATGLSLDTSWTGTVVYGSSDTGNALSTNLSALGNANSVIKLQGAGGHFATSSGSLSGRTLELADKSDGTAALTISNGSSGADPATSYIAAKVKGSGTVDYTFQGSGAISRLTFEGDVSDWDGLFKYSKTKGLHLRFGGAASEVNAEIKNASTGTLSLFVGNTGKKTAFNNTVDVSAISVDADNTMSIGGTITTAALTLNANSILEFAGGVLNVTDSYTLNAGSITLADSLTFKTADDYTLFNVTGEGNTLTMTGLDSWSGSNYLIEGVEYSTALLQDGNSLKLSFNKVIPEPTTATLSLLALAGLAARRRRK